MPWGPEALRDVNYFRRLYRDELSGGPPLLSSCRGIPIYKSQFISLMKEDGTPRLFQYLRPALGGPAVLVHPDRWDEFHDALKAAGVPAPPSDPRTPGE